MDQRTNTGPIITLPNGKYDHDLHIYRAGGRIIPGATEILRDAGFEYPAGNMDKGKAVHLATQFYDEYTLNPDRYGFPVVGDDIYGYLEGWIKFRKETGFVPTRIEEPNINATLCFGATLDREGVVTGNKAHWLVEVKKYFPPPFTALQLALQDLTLPKLSRPRKLVAVELRPNGDYHIYRYDDPNDRQMALFLVSLYWYKRK